MNTYIATAIFGEDEQQLKSTRKSEIKKFALQSIKDGAESVDINYYSDQYGYSYIGSFYADGEMPRLFNK